jgi:hypothetical protein
VPAADWKLRVRVFVQRITQPTCACMLAMSAPTFAALTSLAHWKIALQTGLGTGVLAVLLSFTPVARLLADRYGNAFVMGVLTAIADAWSHPGRFVDAPWLEAVLTGIVSGLIVLALSFVVEDRARRVRDLWGRVRSRARRAGHAPK